MLESSSSNLNQVLNWMMEHSLKYDFTSLRKEVKQAFPAFTPDQFNFPHQDDFIDLATMRAISQHKVSQLEDVDDLKIVISRMKEFAKSESQGPQFGQISQDPLFLSKPAKRELLWSFMVLMKKLKALLQYQSFIKDLQHKFDTEIEDFKTEPLGSEVVYVSEQKKAKVDAVKSLKNLAAPSTFPSSVQKEIDEVTEEIASHGFIKEYEKHMLQTKLKDPTKLELFIQTKTSTSDVAELEVLEYHLGSLKDLSNKNSAEKRLISAVRELASMEEKKEAKWCPLIYLEDPQTKGLIGVKIKNAFEK